MSTLAEYMHFVVESDAFQDLEGACRALVAFLLAKVPRPHSNRVRSMDVICSEESGLLFLNCAVGARSLVTFQQTRAKRVFFLDVVRNVMTFLRCYSTSPRIVFFSDRISRQQSLRKLERWRLSQLDVSHIHAGITIALSDIPSFFFCVYEGIMEPTRSLLAVADGSFYSNCIICASSVVDVESVLAAHLRQRNEALVKVEEVYSVAPAVEVSEFNPLNLESQLPAILQSSGRAFFSKARGKPWPGSGTPDLDEVS